MFGNRSVRFQFLLLISLLNGFSAFSEVVVAPFKAVCGMNPDETAPCWVNLNTRAQAGGNYFSRTDSLHPYGLGWSSSFPGGTGHVSYKAVVGLKIRLPDLSEGVKVVITMEQDGKKVFWEGYDVLGQITKVNEWCMVKNITQFIPAAYTTSDYKLTCYVWNSTGLTPVDIDDFELQLTPVPGKSFIPVLPPAATGAKSTFMDVYWGPDFSIQTDKVNGLIRIVDRNGQTVFDDFRIFTRQRPEMIQQVKESTYAFLQFLGDIALPDGKAFRFGLKDLAGAELKLIVPRDGHAFYIGYEFRTTDYTVMERHSVTFRSNLSPSTIYTGGGINITKDFNPEYWLGKEGISWSGPSMQWSVYRPDTISSLQYDYRNGRFWANVDYSGDHPLLYWPMESESSNYYIDRSATILKAGDRIGAYFQMTRNEVSLPFPSFLDAPNGQEGVFIFTEHADYTVMRSNRAVYFGVDTIAKASQAIGGFVGHSIPVTKSVFYCNPDKVGVEDRAGFVSGEITTVKATNGFREFLLDIQQSGSEIAMHTPDHYTTNRMILNEAFMSLSKDYRLRTWIDHGYDNSRRSNREDVVCDGFVPGSPMYAASLFKEFGVRNVWNCFYEDSSLYSEVTFNGELVTPHPAFGYAYPRPVYWTHPSVTGSIRHFRTTCTLAPKVPGMWEYYINEDRLRFLANQRGVYVAHFYPARIDSTSAFYNWDAPNWTIYPQFDRVLKLLSDFRSTGRLWVPTMNDYLDYVTARDKITFATDASGFAVLHNTGTTAIKGLTMSIHGYDVYIQGKEVSRRKSGDELIFWFDMLPNETVTVRMKSAH